MSGHFTTRHVDGTAVVGLEGEIDLQNSPEVRKELLACLARAKMCRRSGRGRLYRQFRDRLSGRGLSDGPASNHQILSGGGQRGGLEGPSNWPVSTKCFILQ